MVFLGLDSFEQGELPLDMIKPYIIYTNMIQASCSTSCILCVNMVFFGVPILEGFNLFWKFLWIGRRLWGSSYHQWLWLVAIWSSCYVNGLWSNGYSPIMTYELWLLSNHLRGMMLQWNLRWKWKERDLSLQTMACAHKYIYIFNYI